ncbi:hypothetical protein VDGL01_08394 [Verticillium dahliae]
MSDFSLLNQITDKELGTKSLARFIAAETFIYPIACEKLDVFWTQSGVNERAVRLKY